jgi:NAD(P)H dehydrogenase (quinone)
MILVTGATGHFGKTAIDFLLKKGVNASKISALVRDEEKAKGLQEKGVHLIKGDYDNYVTLAASFKGVNRLLFVSGTDVKMRMKQHENVVNAAKEAGVQHIIYTSFSRKKEDETSAISIVTQSHIKTENLIKASVIPYTILRNGIYADMLPVFLGEKVLEAGVYFPAGDGKVSFTTRHDMAEAAAHILTSEGHVGKEYEFANTENISFHDVANILSEITGKKVAYLNPNADEYKTALTQAGVSAEYIGMFAAFAEAMKQGEFETDRTDLPQLLGRKPTPVAQYLEQLYSAYIPSLS